MNTRISAWLVTLLIAFFWMVPLQAQDDENDAAAYTVYITPNPGEGPALEAAIREYHLWIADKPGSFRYTWYSIETGPHTGMYAAWSGNHNWEDFDAEYDWQDEADEKFMASVAPHIKHFHRDVTVEMKEFGHWPDDWSGYDMFQLENWYVEPGHYNAFREGLATIHAALSEGGYGQHYGFHSMVSGGKGNQITLVLPMKGYVDFGENDPSFMDLVAEALGGEEAFREFMSNWGATYRTGESWLVRRLPEASDYGDDE